MATELTAEFITAAVEGRESQKRRIDDQIAELRAVLQKGVPPLVPYEVRLWYSLEHGDQMDAEDSYT